jgi:hypothetical protein
LGEPFTIKKIDIKIDLVTKTEIETYPIIETKIHPATDIEIEIEINITKVKKVVFLANLALEHDYVAQDYTPAFQ